jgi:putative heme-binding domain-containing protein
LLQQILEPSRTIDPKYTLYRVETKSGQLHTGILLARSEKELVLRDAQSKELRVAVSEVESLTPQKSSLMPDLLLRGLTAQQAADLLEYLGSLR